jgi:uncharacterized protein YcnI
MRLVVVVLAALAAAPAAWAHAEVGPASIRVDRQTELTLRVPTESATAATVQVVVTPAAGLRLTGPTTWRGHTRGTVRLTFTARAQTAGDYALHVRQVYSDGEVVNWAGPESSNTPAPVVHVESAPSDNRDRLLIAIVVAIVLVAVFALRGRGRQRPQ